MQISSIVLFVFGLALIGGTSQAASTAFDDFEDGNTNGWIPIASGLPGGSSGVIGDPADLSNHLAYVAHAANGGNSSGSGSYALSMDFAYSANAPLSFVMQATATAVSGQVGGTMHASSGVTVSLLDIFNVTLGRVILTFDTDGVVGNDAILIDNARHTYSLSMGDWAAQGGLSPSDASIEKLSLSFWSASRYFWGGNIYPNYRSNATVYFDDVATIPLDSDGDGIEDSADNCTLLANTDQRDSNGDGFGNVCDPDLNGDLIVNAGDLGLFKSVFFTGDPDADFNGDGVVNAVDLGVLKAFFFQAPGPSGTLP